MIPEEAIEAAAKALFADEQCDRIQKEDVDGNWHSRLNDANRAEYRSLARAALEAAAPFMLVHVHHHYIENHAASFNEGYETAVAQGLADDPTLAGDWLEGKLREAKAQALREAAGGVGTVHLPEEIAIDGGAAQIVRDYLRNIAARIEASE